MSIRTKTEIKQKLNTFTNTIEAGKTRTESMTYTNFSVQQENRDKERFRETQEMLKHRSKNMAPSEGDKDEPEIEDDIEEVPVNLDLENCITKRKEPT